MKSIREEVYLDSEIDQYLKILANQRKITVSELIKQAVIDYIQTKREEVKVEENPLFQLIGLYSSGRPDAGINHDKYLYGKE